MSATKLFSRIAVRSAASVSLAKQHPVLTQLPSLRNFATMTKSASPETPLMHYTATQQATSSINHRLFYVNVALLVFIVDAGSAMVDL